MMIEQGLALEDALDAVTVEHADGVAAARKEAGFLPHRLAPSGWFHVSTDRSGGVEASFINEALACRYRLAVVNDLCNPPSEVTR